MPRSVAVKVSAAVAVILVIVAAAILIRRATSLPQPGSDVYEQVTRAFYHGVAALEVGLLDDARTQFVRATEIVPDEPAAWANLGLTELRLGELERAAAPVQRAMEIAPDNAEVVLLASRMETSRGRIDEGLALLRRAVDLDPDNLRARFGLAEEIERAAGPDADARAREQIEEILRRAPDNLAAIVEATRLNAKLRDGERLRAAVARLETLSAGWPPIALEQYRNLSAAATEGRFDDAARAAVPLRNVLARVPAFGASLSAIRTPTELIAEPFLRFVRLEPAVASPSPADTLTFTTEAGQPGVVAIPKDADDSFELLPMSGGVIPAPVDWNNDFRNDIVIADSGGIRLFMQNEAGAFETMAGPASPPTFPCDCTRAWAADVEMDGDLDIVAGQSAGPTLVLRNNGDGDWTPTPVQTFAAVAGARAFSWGDVDDDADPDAVFVDATGALQILRNQQAGQFSRVDAALPANIVALTIADLNADGTFDVVTMDGGGTIRRTARRQEGAAADAWSSTEVAQWQGLNRATPGSHRLIAADLDNNGGLDLIAAGAGETRIWLSAPDFTLTGIQNTPQGETFSVVDLNGDGRLDLLAQAANGPVRHLTRGAADYHWMVLRPRAQPNAGDQRINSFAAGGHVEVRSGLLVQKQLLTGGSVHVGLGSQTTIDVARIVWPNGIAQAEFMARVDQPLVAEQRLKGSCPWVFAWDGQRVTFVTDFLWRSPLGLRINAQDTAGVAQTEDWVRIRGEQLQPRDGVYDVRITAELWETHFFDHVSLLVVDHREDTEAIVDERFSPAAPPAFVARSLRDVVPVARAWDHHGRDVTDVVARRDGTYLDTFARGRYQGIAEDHFVEFEVPPGVGGRVPRQGTGGGPGPTLIAHGWIYPTDSSINVAIGQGGAIRPRNLSLEALQADGRWTVVHPDLGFPAGKHKTILIDLGAAGSARRLRLRTNLEIYWDALSVGVDDPRALRTARVPLSRADLRYRGFSVTTSLRSSAPETPDYGRLANTAARWRDLAGYHTRFGDVRELLLGVDDRYVIMNAGDEMRLEFPAQAPPAPGWRRDFVLIGDGWEKDGDYNTGHSSTVLPLPSHDRPDYGRGVTSLALEDDPVFQRHRRDWETYHTRYVTPERFVRGLAR